MTVESPIYPGVLEGMAGHGTVSHNADEIERGAFWHTKTVERFFSILKRGIVGMYRHVSPVRLHWDAAEFDFRYDNRFGLGVDDEARTVQALRGIVGKLLTCRDSSAVA